MSDNDDNNIADDGNGVVQNSSPELLEMQDSTKLKHYHALGFRDNRRAKVIQHMDNDEEVTVMIFMIHRSKS